MTKYILITLAVIVLALGWFLVQDKESTESKPEDNLPTPVTLLPYGDVTLESGEEAKFQGIRIQLLEVAEDSRCKEGIVCVWAGTLKVKILIETGGDSSTHIIELNKPKEIGGFEIKLNGEKNGRFSISVKKIKADKSPEKIPEKPLTNCYAGGCSGQICSDQPDAISTCEYREEYACYKTAKCERQSNGQCGWTETAALNMCLDNAR